MNRQEWVTQRRDREEKEGIYIYIYLLPTKDMFDTLDSHFKGIHSLTSKAQPEETTLQAEIATSEYIKFYRQCFPNRIIAKQHILKKNSTDFMHRTGFGLGFLRGQDGNNFTQLFHAWQEVQP